MADAVTSQTLADGTKTAVLKFTNISDGTGESAIKKVDASALGDAPTDLKIQRMWYSTSGMSVNILWDASANVTAYVAAADGYQDFRCFGGLKNNASTGKTGDILFTTVGHTANDTYTVILEVSKS